MCSACSAIIGRPPEPTDGTPRTSLVGGAGFDRFIVEPGSTGAGVYLRTPTETDREAFVALRRASAGSLAPWEPRRGDVDEQFGDQSFDRLLDRRESESDAPFLIHRASDHEIVGYVGLGQILRGPFRSCYIGYWIGDPYVGRGYGTSGVRACLQTAFAPECEGGLGLHRVEAGIVPTNHTSIALVRRVGMRKEGYNPRYLEINGEWRDHERWAITVGDWESSPPLCSPRKPCEP